MGKKKTAQTVKATVAQAKTVKKILADEKAMLKVYIQADVLRRLRMTAGSEGRQPGDLVTELLDKSLPDWKKK